MNTGYKEIVLGGVNLGLYRSGKYGLADVVNDLARLEGLDLIRLSSLEPQLLTESLIESFSRIGKLCPHFHIALQSGSDTVLNRMGRRYDTALIRKLVENLNQAFPHVALGFDVITGFPGETDTEHAETVDLLQSVKPAYLHVFSYSKRKGTPAEKMPDQVPKGIKNQRSSQLHRLSESFQQQYRQSLALHKVPLRGIVETCECGISEFVSDHYLRYAVKSEHQIGQLIRIEAFN